LFLGIDSVWPRTSKHFDRPRIWRSLIINPVNARTEQFTCGVLNASSDKGTDDGQNQRNACGEQKRGNTKTHRELLQRFPSQTTELSFSQI